MMAPVSPLLRLRGSLAGLPELVEREAVKSPSLIVVGEVAGQAEHELRAFALEECGRLAEAQALIEHSMALNPRNAHGAHIKAHVLYEMGEDRAALDYLGPWLDAYPREGLMHCHISWHVALFALILGDAARAWSVSMHTAAAVTSISAGGSKPHACSPSKLRAIPTLAY